MMNRQGFTFVEMLLVLVLGAILLAGVYGTLIQQEEAYAQFNAVAATQQDARGGLALLSSQLREVSAEGGDLVAATANSFTIRQLRQFGIVCASDNSNKRLVVGTVGVEGFADADSIAVYIDGDSLQAADDTWGIDGIASVSATSSCSGGPLGGLGATLGTLFPSGSLELISTTTGSLKFDEVYPGAPVRGFDHMTYQVGTWEGQPMLQRVDSDGDAAPLFGPVTADDGLVMRYFDGGGTELTSFPLSADDRRSVQRVQVELRTRRRTGAVNGSHTETLITDVYLRGN